MIVISDTSVISNLIQIGQVQLLHQLYNQIIIPPTVYEELSAIGSQKIFVDKQTWISIVAPPENEVLLLLDYLDKGEAEAIILYKAIKADLLLIGELKGRNIARNMGIKLVGIVGILIMANENALITSVKDLLDDLINKANFRVGIKLYNEALEKVNELNL
jgi:predicted nucleic acid-binding protein